MKAVQSVCPVRAWLACAILLALLPCPAADREDPTLRRPPPGTLKKLKAQHTYIGDLHKIGRFEGQLGTGLGVYLDYANFAFMIDDSVRMVNNNQHKKAFDNIMKFAVELKMPPSYVLAKFSYQGVDRSYRWLADHCYTQGVMKTYRAHRKEQLKQLYLKWFEANYPNKDFGGEFSIDRMKTTAFEPVLKQWMRQGRDGFEAWYANNRPRGDDIGGLSYIIRFLDLDYQRWHHETGKGYKEFLRQNWDAKITAEVLQERSRAAKIRIKNLAQNTDFYFVFRLADLPPEEIKEIRYESLEGGSTQAEVHYSEKRGYHYIKVSAAWMQLYLGRSLAGTLHVRDLQNTDYRRPMNFNSVMTRNKPVETDDKGKGGHYRIIYDLGALRLKNAKTHAILRIKQDEKLELKGLGIQGVSTPILKAAPASPSTDPSTGSAAQIVSGALVLTQEAIDLYQAAWNGTELVLQLPAHLAALRVRTEHAPKEKLPEDTKQLLGQKVTRVTEVPLPQPRTELKQEWAPNPPPAEKLSVDLNLTTTLPHMPPEDPETPVTATAAASAIDGLLSGAREGRVHPDHVQRFSRRWIRQIEPPAGSGKSEYTLRAEVEKNHLADPLRNLREQEVKPEMARLTREAREWREDLAALRKEAAEKHGAYASLFQGRRPPGFRSVQDAIQMNLRDPLGQIDTFESEKERPVLNQVLPHYRRMIGHYNTVQNDLQNLHTYYKQDYIPAMEKLQERRGAHAEQIAALRPKAELAGLHLRQALLPESDTTTRYVKRTLIQADDFLSALDSGLRAIVTYRARLIRIKDHMMAYATDLHRKLTTGSERVVNWQKEILPKANAMFEQSRTLQQDLTPLLKIVAGGSRALYFGGSRPEYLPGPLNVDHWEKILEPAIQQQAWTSIEHSLKPFRTKIPSAAASLKLSDGIEHVKLPAYTTLPGYLDAMGRELVKYGAMISPVPHFEQNTETLIRSYESLRNHASGRAPAIYIAAHGLDEASGLLDRGRRIGREGKKKANTFFKSITVDRETCQEIQGTTYTLNVGLGNMSVYYTDFGKSLIDMATLLRKAERAEKGGMDDWGRKIQGLVAACLKADTPPGLTKAYNALYHPYRWRSGLDNDSGYNVMGQRWALHPADDYLVPDIHKAGLHFAGFCNQRLTSAIPGLESAISELRSLSDSPRKRRQTLASPDWRKNVNDLLAPELPAPGGRCVEWLRQTAETAGDTAAFDTLNQLSEKHARLSETLRNLMQGKPDTTATAPAPTAAVDPDTPHPTPQVTMQQAYQAYIDKYNAFTTLMHAGKGETPEGKRAFQEYQEARKTYEAAIQ